MIRRWLFICVVVGLLFSIGKVIMVRAQSSDDQLAAKKQEITDLQNKLTEIQSQKTTLAQTINYLSTKILLTQKEIEKTEAEIALLSDQISTLEGKIGVVNVDLERQTSIWAERVKTAYISTLDSNPFFLLLTTNGLSDFYRSYKYLRVTHDQNHQVILALENARVNYDAEKQAKEEKQAEVADLNKKLTDQKTSLDKQQQEKQAALTVTRNDEKRYQDQLAKALAEIQAIQSIIAGKGSETVVGKVNEGDQIATIINGPSPCSSGSHLHFQVTKDNSDVNPANYLSNKSVIWDDGPDGPFPLTGSWRWPVDDPVRVTQGYGMTFYAATLHYYGGNPHTGVDMISDTGNYKVMAVKAGTLYRGAIGCGGGTLRYVHVDQGDNLSTYYLHVNY